MYKTSNNLFVSFNNIVGARSPFSRFLVAFWIYYTREFQFLASIARRATSSSLGASRPSIIVSSSRGPVFRLSKHNM